MIRFLDVLSVVIDDNLGYLFHPFGFGGEEEDDCFGF